MIMARYLVVNPVGTQAWDASDAAYLRPLSMPGEEVQVVSLPDGPPAVENEVTRAEAEYGVATLLRTLLPPAARAYDAVIINCFADPGLGPAREMLGIPVLGAGETALALAPLFGEGVCVLAPDELTGRITRHYARRLGLEQAVQGVFPIGMRVADLDRRPEATVERVVEVARHAHRQTGAQVMVLGCTGLASLAAGAASVLEAEGLVVLEPFALAFRVAEVLVRLGLTHFRGGLYSGAPGSALPEPVGIAEVLSQPVPALEVPSRPAAAAEVLPPPVAAAERVDILLVNAVVSESLLEWVPDYARSVLPSWTRVRVRHISWGPPCIESFWQEATARPAIVKAALQESGYAASVVNCFADPAVPALREATGRPALGPAEASCRLALLLGHRFGVVSTGGNVGPWTELQVREMGLSGRLAGAVGVKIGVLALASDETATVRAIVTQARKLAEAGGAEVIVLGCTGMARMAREVADEVRVPVLEPLAVALNLADLVVRARPWHRP